MLSKSMRDQPECEMKHRITGVCLRAKFTGAPEEVIRQVAYFRSSEKSDPLFYARLMVRRDVAVPRAEALS